MPPFRVVIFIIQQKSVLLSRKSLIEALSLSCLHLAHYPTIIRPRLDNGSLLTFAVAGVSPTFIDCAGLAHHNCFIFHFFIVLKRILLTAGSALNISVFQFYLVKTHCRPYISCSFYLINAQNSLIVEKSNRPFPVFFFFHLSS